MPAASQFKAVLLVRDQFHSGLEVQQQQHAVIAPRAAANVSITSGTSGM